MPVNPILIIIGTRPEGIKMIPLYLELKKSSLPVLLVSTGQHTTLLEEVFEAFRVKPDIDLALGKPQQDLSYLTQVVLAACAKLYGELSPALVAVQGDTTTVMAAGLAAFYSRVPIVHVEAGLRTYDLAQPYPEEMNRRVLGVIANYHCAPTSLAAAHLLSEGVERAKIFCTGNTVVDALEIMQSRINTGQVQVDAALKERVEYEKGLGKKIVLLTAHRRESFDGGLLSIFTAVKKLLSKYEDLFFIYPQHPNPHVKKAVDQAGIGESERMLIMPAVSYQDLVYILMNVDIVMTDSGGLQEEAISLGKPTLVLREKTERSEGVWEGYAHLVGTDEQRIITNVEKMMMQHNKNTKQRVYGDGNAARRIVSIIQERLEHDLPPQEMAKLAEKSG